MANQLSSSLHVYYENEPYEHEPQWLRSRLWLSINGMYLKNNKALYLGGADRKDVKD